MTLDASGPEQQHASNVEASPQYSLAAKPLVIHTNL